MINYHAIVPLNRCPVGYVVDPQLGGPDLLVGAEKNIVAHDYRAERVCLCVDYNEIDCRDIDDSF